MAVPGAAVSPGTSNCNLASALAVTVIGELVLLVLLPSSKSEAVTVWLPAVLSVTAKLFVPPTSAALSGGVALLSEAVIPTVSLTLLSRFQFASTALTVTLKGTPAACAVGVPSLPGAVPGAAVWPGARICNLANAPAFTEIAGLVLLVIVPWVTSEAVTVALPAVLKATPKVWLA